MTRTTQAAQIKALGERIVTSAEAMEKPGADVRAEVASIDRLLVRIKIITTDAQVTVCHERRKPVTTLHAEAFRGSIK